MNIINTVAISGFIHTLDMQSQLRCCSSVVLLILPLSHSLKRSFRPPHNPLAASVPHERTSRDFVPSMVVVHEVHRAWELQLS